MNHPPNMPAPIRKPLGFGSTPDLGPLSEGIFNMLASGSPRLALAMARGVPLAPYIINVRAIFPDTTTVAVPDVGSDVKITQDTLVDAMMFRIQNESITANQNPYQVESDYYYGFQGGIEATLDVQGAPRYTVAERFTPLANLADAVNGNSHWPAGWVLTYQQQLFMSFRSVITLPYSPIEVVCTFRARTPVTREFAGAVMDNARACALLQKEFDIQLSDSYIARVSSS